jgi:ABC-type transport system involved in multi-copper enzyme maturation permease subunit
MNRTIARALLLDAFSQVMDNKVFRLLVLVSIVLIAPAFLIGFRDDGIHILLGWKFIAYESLFGGFHGAVPHVKDVHVWMIQQLQALIVQGLAGSLGILICIAATAFFVPRMLERGAADIFFTKPISRVVLLLSRYVAGLIFVGVLSFLLVLGIHLGLLLVSGYSDPAFLWCTLTLVYIYALVQTVSVIVGVVTRSSVAAILCTLVFFTFNGCIHGLWIGKEWATERQTSERENAGPDAVQQLEAGLPILKFLHVTLDGLHYALPKTNDADVLTRKLRTVVAGRSTVLFDEAGKLEIDRNPEGFSLETAGGTVDLLRTPTIWVSKGPDGMETARITLSRRSRLLERLPPNARPDEKPRTVHQSTGQAASEFLKSLEGRAGIVGTPDKQHEPSVRVSGDLVRWSEDGATGRLVRQRMFFSVDDWMYELDVTLNQAETRLGERETRAGQFMDGVRVVRTEAAYVDPKEWYEARLGWTAPIKFNAFFSILSSLAFAILMLAAAAWRLARIDF